MFINELQKKLSQYQIKDIAEKDYDDLYQLYKSNTDYFYFTQNHEVTRARQ